LCFFSFFTLRCLFALPSCHFMQYYCKQNNTHKNKKIKIILVRWSLSLYCAHSRIKYIYIKKEEGIFCLELWSMFSGPRLSDVTAGVSSFYSWWETRADGPTPDEVSVARPHFRLLQLRVDLLCWLIHTPTWSHVFYWQGASGEEVHSAPFALPRHLWMF